MGKNTKSICIDTQMVHGAGIFTYTWAICGINVEKKIQHHGAFRIQSTAPGSQDALLIYLEQLACGTPMHSCAL